jgi:hypothetical protein
MGRVGWCPSTRSPIGWPLGGWVGCRRSGPGEDLARAREAIKSGDLTKPVSADAVAKTLKIGLAKARAVRDTVNAEPHEEPAEA